MDISNPYFQRMRLAVRILPMVAKESCFALKGGTAINLFVRDLPRLSVDIDLVYLPLDDRQTAMRNARAALDRIAKEIRAEIPGTKTLASNPDSDALKLNVLHEGKEVKIELSPVLRGSVFPPVTMAVTERVEAVVGFAEIAVMALPDLYAGKICAALDRQHPRDLFDVKLLLENEGISDDLRKTFLVYLISGGRPLSEIIAPNRKSIRGIFEGEFLRMTDIPIIIEELEEAREQLIAAIHAGLTNEEKQFLLSFKAKAPDWKLLGIEGVEHLPAVKWKLHNLEKMPKDKHEKALQLLREALKA